MIADATRRYLLFRARQALAAAMESELGVRGLDVPTVERPDDDALDAPARLFVSWHDGQALVGCIGTLEPAPALEDAVVRYSVLAGLHDRRTPAPDPARWDRLSCEISLLGEPRPLPATGIDAIARLLVPRRDGVIVSLGAQRAFFLPVVWDKLPERHEFLSALSRKAGLDPSVVGDLIKADVLDVEAFGERPHEIN